MLTLKDLQNDPRPAVTTHLLDPATGLLTEVSLVGIPVTRGGETFPSQSHYEAQVAALKRSLESVEFRASVLGKEGLLPGQKPPTKEELAGERRSIDGEREFVLRRLKELEED
jgi:hypothetical protein